MARRKQVRTRKGSDRVGQTHELGVEEGTCQDMKRKHLSKVHSPTRVRIGRDKSGHGKKVP